ncbi:MAG: ParA family protein [Symploca sp. SIO2C1]|nr:ParA family protein [Symploca sp. SIO2C1]
MNTKIIAFFNNKGRVGKTSLIYHLAWMYNELGFRVVAADLDPQANLTAAFLNEDRLEELWLDGNRPNTIFGCVQPLIKGIGDLADPHLEYIEDLCSYGNLALLVGDLSLSGFEDQLSEVWPKCMDGDERAFRVISAFWRVMQKTAVVHQADLILVDLGPNLGAINRAALIAADYVVMPLSPDLFSLQGLRNLGPTLRRWRKNWKDRLHKNPADDLELPQGQIQPIGYVVLHHSVRLDRLVKAYNPSIATIPNVYREAVLAQPGDNHLSVANDPHCLALVKNYHSLMRMAQEARKPMFYLKPADGALGAHATAAKKVYGDFQRLAGKIAERTEVKIS